MNCQRCKRYLFRHESDLCGACRGALARATRWAYEVEDFEDVHPVTRLRHPATGRFMAGDCERDCLTACAGLCGVPFSDFSPEDDPHHGASTIFDEEAR